MDKTEPGNKREARTQMFQAFVKLEVAVMSVTTKQDRIEAMAALSLLRDYIYQSDLFRP